MRYFTFLLIMVWSGWAYTQPTFLPTTEKNYKQQLLDQLLEKYASEPHQEECLPCLSCLEEGALPGLQNELSALRWTEIELRDSLVCYSYNPYTEEWTPSSKYVYTYNEAHQQVENTYFIWDNGWDFYSQSISYYNDAGLLSESTRQIWDMGWINSSRILFFYNDVGQLTEYLYVVWDEDSGDWRNLSAHLYSYDAQGRLIEELFRSDRTYPSGILADQDKSIYEYADTDDPLSITRFRYYLSSEEWLPRERSLFTYFTAGTVQEELVQRWNGPDWRNASRILYSFDGNGYTIERKNQESYGAENWTNIDRYLYEKDAEGDVLEATYQKWDMSTEEWQNNNQYTYSYDNRNRRTDSYTREWKAIAYDWRTDYSTRVEYDGNGNEIEVSHQSWEYDSNALVNSYRTLKTYDGQNHLMTETHQNWREGNWQNTVLLLYEYDELGSVTRRQRLLWKEELAEWAPYDETITQYQDGLPSIQVNIEFWENGDTSSLNRSVYTYDDRDSLVEILIQFSSPFTDVWWNSQRTTIAFNPMGLRSETLEQKWQVNEWINVSRVVYTYDALGQRVEQLEQKWQVNEWINDWMEAWAFNDDGLVIDHTAMSWDTFSQRWEYSSRRLFTYDEAGRETIYTLLTWSDYHGRLVYSYRYFSIYDEATGLLLFNMVEYYDAWITEKWELNYRWMYEYNEQGLLTYFYSDRASPAQVGWENAGHCQTYWRTVVPAAEVPAPEIHCILANPYTAGSPIIFEGLDANRHYELQLIGQWGHILYREVFQGNATLSIRTGLPSGMYFLRLHDAVGLVYQQKLIIHSVR